MKQTVGSREYKVMLQKGKFVGAEAALMERAGEFWQAFREAIEPIVLDTDGSLDEVEKRRLIRFYDTTDCRLKGNDYIFRERIDLIKDKREVTLKFRHSDRYVSQDRDMAADDEKQAKTKFEEDIKLPFRKLYSFSTKQPISDKKKLNKLKDPGKLYPDLKQKLKSYEADEPIKVVGDFTAREVVITGADFQIGKSPKVEADCALIAWYDANGAGDEPGVVEFSFKYENKTEDYDGPVAQRAYEVFQMLGQQENTLADWVYPDGLTKTAYVYSKCTD